jgi:hypothetical protein
MSRTSVRARPSSSRGARAAFWPNEANVPPSGRPRQGHPATPASRGPRQRGPMITAGGYGSRLSPRCREGRPGRQPVQSCEPTCGCGKRSPAPLHCSGLLFTRNAATPTCRTVGARSADLTPPGAPPVFSLLFTGKQRSACTAAAVATRTFRARGAVTACRPNRSQGQP